MNSFNITASLKNTEVVFTIIPAASTENSYSTYFQFLLHEELYSEVRLNNEFKWEVCKGHELPEDELNTIMKQVKTLMYGKPASGELIPEAPKYLMHWFHKIIHMFGSDKSAA